MDIYFYFIELENNKYFVITWPNDNMTIDDMYLKDELNPCIDWLLINKPIRILEKHRYNGGFSLDDHVLIYMGSHGQDNVRGGSYIEVNLPKYQKDQIALTIVHTNTKYNAVLIVEEIEEEKLSCWQKLRLWFCKKDKDYKKPLLDLDNKH